MQLIKVCEICFQYPVGESDFSLRVIAVKSALAFGQGNQNFNVFCTDSYLVEYRGLCNCERVISTDRLGTKFPCRFSLRLLNIGSYCLAVLPQGRTSLSARSLERIGEDSIMHSPYER